MANHKLQLPARVHSDDRNRIEGLKAIGAFLQGAPRPQVPLSYYTPILIQCTLPHSDPKTSSYVKTNGDFSLIVSSGVDNKGKPYGVPYGSFPRLVLAYIITRVIQTGKSRIELESYFSSFLREIGYTGNHKGTGVKGQRVHKQLLRLLMASIRFECHTGTEEQGRMAGINMWLILDSRVVDFEDGVH